MLQMFFFFGGGGGGHKDICPGRDNGVFPVFSWISNLAMLTLVNHLR